MIYRSRPMHEHRAFRIGFEQHWFEILRQKSLAGQRGKLLFGDEDLAAAAVPDVNMGVDGSDTHLRSLR